MRSDLAYLVDDAPEPSWYVPDHLPDEQQSRAVQQRNRRLFGTIYDQLEYRREVHGRNRPQQESRERPGGFEIPEMRRDLVPITVDDPGNPQDSGADEYSHDVRRDAPRLARLLNRVHERDTAFDTMRAIQRRRIPGRLVL